MPALPIPSTPPEKPKKLTEMTLDELYENPPKGKFTPSVMKRIVALEDFSKISSRYCEKICKLPDADKTCLSDGRIVRSSSEVDVLIIKDFDFNENGSNTFVTNEQVERVIRDITRHMAMGGLKDVRWDIVNVMRCRPSDKKITDVKVRLCLQYLYHEINVRKPKVILNFSKAALKPLGIPDTFNNARGKIYQTNCPSLEYQPYLVSTIHPKATTYIRQNSSGKFWGPDYFSVIQNDFKKAGDIARGVLVPRFDLEGVIQELVDTRLRICETIEDVRREIDIIVALPEVQMISFDTETTGLDPFSPDAKLILIQFGYSAADGDVISVVIPLWHRENTTCDPDLAWAEASKVLLGNWPKVGHNSKFDCLYIRAVKQLVVNNVFTDTMYLLHAMNSGVQGCYSLKTALWDYLPELNLGGYEDQLPPLTKIKEDKEDDDDSDNDSEE